MSSSSASAPATQALLQAVAASNKPDASAADAKRAILARVAELERNFSPDSPGDVLPMVDGTWALVYSTKASEDNQDDDDDWLQQATGSLYQVFFKFAPFLAGSQDTGGGKAVSNLQVVDLARGRVDNKVDVQLPGERTLRIRVMGEVAPVAGTADLTVTFTSWQLQLDDLGPLKLPLPRPVGSLRTTFCDDNVRIARGGRGGVFVTKRVA